MKSLVLVFFIYVISLTKLEAQITNATVATSDSIEYYAKALTGKWKLIGYYKNDKFIEFKISSSFSDSSPGERIDKILTKDGLVNRKYLNDSLISIYEPVGIELVEIEFYKNGKGWYQHHSDYVVGRDWQIKADDQPLPEIVFEQGKYLLFLSGTFGEDTKSEFNLNGDTLTIFFDNLNEKYIRLKN